MLYNYLLSLLYCSCVFTFIIKVISLYTMLYNYLLSLFVTPPSQHLSLWELNTHHQSLSSEDLWGLPFFLVTFANAGCRKRSKHERNMPMAIKDTMLCYGNQAENAWSPDWKHFDQTFDFFQLLNVENPSGILHSIFYVEIVVLYQGSFV